MTRVSILPVPSEKGGISYRAVAGDKHSQGATVGQAIDALNAQLSKGEGGTQWIVLEPQPDRFFTSAQQHRLGELMARWRTARDGEQLLPAAEQAELDTLVDAELRASAERAAALTQESRQ